MEDSGNEKRPIYTQEKNAQIERISGFEILELLDYPSAIMLTTAFDEYAIKVFETNAIDYLLRLDNAFS